MYGVDVSSTGQYIIVPSYGSNLLLSSDYGATWQTKATTRNWYAAAISGSGKYQLAGNYSSGYLYNSSDFGVTWIERSFSAQTWRCVAINKSIL